jgi:putative flippase GtrA
MIRFTKAQIASILATGVDFLVFFLLVKKAGIWNVAGSAIGTICGGIVHFLLSRNWVFRGKEGKWHEQAGRYVAVWIGNLILNTSVFYVFTKYAGMNAQVAKIITATGIAIFYNYFLQKRFVFKQSQ